MICKADFITVENANRKVDKLREQRDALKQYGAKLLRDVADTISNGNGGPTPSTYLNRMADELENNKK